MASCRETLELSKVRWNTGKDFEDFWEWEHPNRPHLKNRCFQSKRYSLVPCGRGLGWGESFWRPEEGACLKKIQLQNHQGLSLLQQGFCQSYRQESLRNQWGGYKRLYCLSCWRQGISSILKKKFIYEVRRPRKDKKLPVILMLVYSAGLRF